MGYVYDPTVEQSSPYGISDTPPVQHRSPDKVIIGIFGGSFADDIAYNMANELAEKLKPSFPGKEPCRQGGVRGRRWQLPLRP